MGNSMDLSEKTILLTGASSGIGRETARVLQGLGARLVLVARREEKLLDLRKECKGIDHLVEVFDLNRVEMIEEFIDNVVTKVGQLYGMVHCAGIDYSAPFRKTSTEQVDKLMKINVYSFLELVKAFSKKNNCQKDGGSIVALSSVMGINPKPGLLAYGATKAALVNVVKTMAMELSSKRVRVNCVSPAYVNTEMFENLRNILSQDQLKDLLSQIPLGLGEPIDIANAIAFLMSDTGRWVTGTNLIIDGGYSLK